LLADSRFATNTERLKNREVLWPILDEAFRARNADEWIPLLEAEEIPVGVVNTLDRVVSDPQIRHRNMVLELESDDGRRAGVMGNPIKFSDSAAEEKNYPRALGADTAAVLGELLNLSDTDIAELIRVKAIVAGDFEI
jgi:crotonobetainyl-CoA:carnitine CoA-transferase CaiB-like acyl-CoA transferase